jgi:hypothetical protein
LLSLNFIGSQDMSLNSSSFWSYGRPSIDYSHILRKNQYQLASRSPQSHKSRADDNDNMGEEVSSFAFCRILSHTNTVKVMLQPPSFTGGERPQTALHALFQTQAGTIVEPTTICKQAGCISQIFTKVREDKFAPTGEGKVVSREIPQPRMPAKYILLSNKCS